MGDARAFGNVAWTWTITGAGDLIPKWSFELEKMRAVGIDIFRWRAGDVNPLIDRLDTARIRGLTSPARRTQPQSNPRGVYFRNASMAEARVEPGLRD